MQASDGSIVGFSGQKYGLQLPAARQPGIARKPAAPVPKPANVFGLDDEDDEEDVEAQIARQAERKRSATKVQQMYEAALAEDPNVFNYDEVYDSIQQARVQPRQQEKIERKSRYIGQLKEQAEQRKREEDIRYERRLLKERQVEDHLFEGKEKFVTAAYRKKLEEDKKWQEEQKKREEEEERNDVRKVGHLGNFYANLLTKNVAMGASKGAEKQPVTDQGAQSGEQGPSDPADQAGQGKTAQAAAEKAASLDRYEVLRLEAERARRASQGPDKGPSSAADHVVAASETQGQPAAPSAADPGPGPRQESPPKAGPGSVKAGAEEGAEPSGQEAVPAATRKRRNDEDSVVSARERYLARKRQGG